MDLGTSIGRRRISAARWREGGGPFRPFISHSSFTSERANERRDEAAADRKLNDGVTEPFYLARSVVRQPPIGLEVWEGKRAADQWMDGWVGARAGERATGFGGRRPRHGGPLRPPNWKK